MHGLACSQLVQGVAARTQVAGSMFSAGKSGTPRLEVLVLSLVS